MVVMWMMMMMMMMVIVDMMMMMMMMIKVVVVALVVDMMMMITMMMMRMRMTQSLNPLTTPFTAAKCHRGRSNLAGEVEHAILRPAAVDAIHRLEQVVVNTLEGEGRVVLCQPGGATATLPKHSQHQNYQKAHA